MTFSKISATWLRMTTTPDYVSASALTHNCLGKILPHLKAQYSDTEEKDRNYNIVWIAFFI